MLSLLIILSFITTPAMAQQVSNEQLLRQINAALAQENVRLGAENDQLRQQLQQQKPVEVPNAQHK